MYFLMHVQHDKIYLLYFQIYNKKAQKYNKKSNTDKVKATFFFLSFSEEPKTIFIFF